MLDIDRLEDEIAPIAPDVSVIRGLISTLELCHHKSERWVGNIIEAIGLGETNKGLGTCPPGRCHPAEEVWQAACAALAAWCAGCPSAALDSSVGVVPASRLLASLGERSQLKEWQVQRVIEKIRSTIRWPQPVDDPSAQYVWLLINDEGGESFYRDECPVRYREHEDFWMATARTMIHDSESGEEAELSLGLAIDMLWPCHWDFVQNLRIVLEAIGGRPAPEKPFAACGRNIALVPCRERMENISSTLRIFCDESTATDADGELMELLGEPTKEKRWLAASLDKTIRLQLNPTSEMREACTLAGPDWIKQ